MDTPTAPRDNSLLGPRVELFTTSRAQVYVGFVLGTLLTAGGLGLAGCGVAQIPEARNAPTKDAKERATIRFLGGLAVGGVVAIFGVLGIWVARSLSGTGVEVGENGFRRWPPGPDSHAVVWGAVARIEERYVHDEVPLELGGPLLSETYRQIVVLCRDGSRFVVDRETVAAVGRLVKRLRPIAERHSIPWVVIGKPE